MKLSKAADFSCDDSLDLSDKNGLQQNSLQQSVLIEPLPIYSGPQEHLGWLVRTIEKSIIPRLLSTHLNAETADDAKHFLSKSIEDPEKIAT